MDKVNTVVRHWSVQNYSDCSWVCSVSSRCPFHHPLVHRLHSLHLPHAERELTTPACCCDHWQQSQDLVETGMQSVWAGTHWESRAWHARGRVVENHLLPTVQRSGFPWRRIFWLQCRYFLLTALPFLSPVWLPWPLLELNWENGQHSG